MIRLRVLAVSHRRDLERELDRLGVESIQARTIAAKGLGRAILVADFDPREANILRQEMLALGAEAVLPRTAGARRPVDVILLGTMQQYHRLVDRLNSQPGSLPALGREVTRLLKDWQGPKRLTLQAGPYSLPIGSQTYVMGIINVTSNSFTGDGVLGAPYAALARAREFVAQGAHIIDIGGESARADVPVVDVQDEIARVVPVVEAIAAELDIPISIDTYKPQVAEAAIRAGATIINDIGGLRLGLMVVMSLLPIGLSQAWASVEHGLWYARSAEFLQQPVFVVLRWMRAVGDTLFIAGVSSLVWFVLGLWRGWSLRPASPPPVERMEAPVEALTGARS